MRLDLAEILAHAGMRYEYSVDEPPIVDEDLECTSRIRGRILFTNTGNVLLIEGRVKARVAVPCSRCLVYFEEEAETPISEQFTLQHRPMGPTVRHSQTVVEEDENPDAGKLFEGHLFDLTELLRQSVMLSLSSQPLHDELCKGLCPICGQDLNERSCACSPEAPHPVLAGLAELLKET